MNNFHNNNNNRHNNNSITRKNSLPAKYIFYICVFVGLNVTHFFPLLIQVSHLSFISAEQQVFIAVAVLPDLRISLDFYTYFEGNKEKQFSADLAISNIIAKIC